jgi:hypothetical protein
MISPEKYEEALAESDPEMAFCKLEQLFRNVFQEKIERADNNSAYEEAVIEYMNHTIAAARELKLTMLDGWEVPKRSEQRTRSMYDRAQDFTTAVDHFKVQVKIDNARRRRRYSIHLPAADKARIRGHVEQIKSIIETSTLSTDKKEQLLDKLNTFLDAVDKDRTGLETFSDTIIGIAHAFGESAREPEPLRKLIDSISRLMARAQARDGGTTAGQLPKRGDPNRLPPPRRGLPPPSKEPATEDDDIPF